MLPVYIYYNCAIVVCDFLFFFCHFHYLDAPEWGGTGSVLIRDGEYRWDPTAKRPTIQNVNLNVKQGQLVIVTGKVGCGKSSLLAATLGEMNRRWTDDYAADNNLKAYRGRVA